MQTYKTLLDIGTTIGGASNQNEKYEEIEPLSLATKAKKQIHNKYKQTLFLSFGRENLMCVVGLNMYMAKTLYVMHIKF